ncbi:MAG TPA: alpha/beta fold hydrolase, partial [Kiloniellales bacterium]|nr:alpha/beta fold hydrolase [Kiloniellales bacterium]
MSPEFITIDGVRLEVRRLAGTRPGPTLIFLHEGLGSVALWRDFPDKVAAATGLPVVVYSRRGYGRSDPRAESYAPDFMHREALDVLPKLLAALGIERPLLVGHSDGASIALIHASRHPVAGVVALAPHVFVEAITVAAIAKAADAARDTDLLQRLGRHHARPDHAFWGWNDIWLLPAFRDWTIEDVLPAIQAPVLAIQGEDDEYGTMAQIDA